MNVHDYKNAQLERIYTRCACLGSENGSVDFDVFFDRTASIHYRQNVGVGVRPSSFDSLVTFFSCQQPKHCWLLQTVAKSEVYISETWFLEEFLQCSENPVLHAHIVRRPDFHNQKLKMNCYFWYSNSFDVRKSLRTVKSSFKSKIFLKSNTITP